MFGTYRSNQISSKEDDFVPVARFRYLPPASLDTLDMEHEAGLERLIYLQSLINDEIEQ